MVETNTSGLGIRVGSPAVSNSSNTSQQHHYHHHQQQPAQQHMQPSPTGSTHSTHSVAHQQPSSPHQLQLPNTAYIANMLLGTAATAGCTTGNAYLGQRIQSHLRERSATDGELTPPHLLMPNQPHHLHQNHLHQQQHNFQQHQQQPKPLPQPLQHTLNNLHRVHANHQTVAQSTATTPITSLFTIDSILASRSSPTTSTKSSSSHQSGSANKYIKLESPSNSPPPVSSSGSSPVRPTRVPAMLHPGLHHLSHLAAAAASGFGAASSDFLGM